MTGRGLHIAVMMVVMAVMTACSPSVPEQYIQPEDMEDLLYDYFVAQGMSSLPSQNYDEQNYRKELYFNAVLKKHGLTRADFDSSLVYYYTRADRFSKIYKRVQDRLSDDALALGASEGEVERFTSQSLTGDTTDVWEGSRHAILLPYAPYNYIQFEQKADTSYHVGDSFMLTFKSNFLYQGGMKDAVAYLTVKYDNDSVGTAVTHFSSSTNTQLRFVAGDRQIRKLTGFFYLGSGSESTVNMRMLFLTDIRLIRFHKTETVKPVIQDKEEENPQIDSLRPTHHRLGERPVLQHKPTDFAIEKN